VRELEQAIVSGFTDDLFTRLCPWWRRGLHDWCGGDADGGAQRVRQLQLMFGDSISPNRTLEKIFVVSGPRRSGKGCIQEALKAACGEDAVATPSFFDLGDRFGLVSFLGKSLAIFSDAHMGHMTDGARVTEVLKVISGGDAVTVRDLHTAPQTNVKIGCRFWIFVNDMMRLTDSSGALAGRFVIWPMLRSFFDSEEGDVKRGIMGEGAGIAVWALCGYVELFGMKRPAIEMGGMARTIADEFAGSSSVIISFLRECCVCTEGADGRVEVKYDPTYWEPFGEVYNVYRRHCERQGNQPVANNRFVAQLRPHVPLIDTDQLGTGTRYRKLVGIKLRDDLDSELTQPAGQRLVSYARPGDVVPGAAVGGGEPSLPFEQRYPT
jgi:putative DNA primase/helicase